VPGVVHRGYAFRAETREAGIRVLHAVQYRHKLLPAGYRDARKVFIWDGLPARLRDDARDRVHVTATADGLTDPLLFAKRGMMRGEVAALARSGWVVAVHAWSLKPMHPEDGPVIPLGIVTEDIEAGAPVPIALRGRMHVTGPVGRPVIFYSFDDMRPGG
jgi:hypothetical protein